MHVCSIDEGFPVITFQFENSLPLPVYPHNYLFEVRVSNMVIKTEQYKIVLSFISYSKSLSSYLYLVKLKAFFVCSGYGILHWLAGQWNAGKGWAGVDSFRRYSTIDIM